MRCLSGIFPPFVSILMAFTVWAEQPALKVGVPTVLSGDFVNLGQNIQRTVETYQKHLLRHRLDFEFEDARVSSQDGLRACQALINAKQVFTLIGAISSNGTAACAALVNSSRTVMLSPVTGGTSVDNAGEYIFRIANSDVLSGTQQAKLFESRSLKKVALLTEQTEHTEDVAQAFKRTFTGKLVYEDTFSPGTTDYKTQIAAILRAKPGAIFMATQTGVPLALFLQQLKSLGGFAGEIHTTFDAAINADAKKVAGDLLKGVYYMAPIFDQSNPKYQKFLALYRADHKRDPDIPFQTASTVDALDMLQAYLDSARPPSREGFKEYLLAHIKKYDGLMGTYSFDEKGNSDMGFVAARIE